MNDINITGNTAGRDINIRVEEIPSDTINDIRQIKEQIVFDSAEKFNSEPIPHSTFHFAAANVDFIGREDELRHLKSLCGYDDEMNPLDTAQSPFTWWVVIGEGASGKSRLCYELGKLLKEKEWSVCWPPTSHNYEDLKQCSSQLKRNTLFILDDAEYKLRNIGQWMTLFNNAQRTDILIRVILIKRHMPTDFREFVGQLSESDSNLHEFLGHNVFKSAPLLCRPLGKESLPLIIQSYLKSHEKEVDKGTLEKIVEFLLKLDKPHMSTDEAILPLFAVMLADYWVNNEDIPVTHNQIELIEYAARKEKNYIKNSITAACGEDDRLLECALDIVSVATIIGGLHKDKLSVYLPKTEAYLQTVTRSKRRAFLELSALFLSEQCTPIQPDIIGEYFLLMYFEENDNINEILDVAWNNHYNTARIITRILQDYPQESSNLRKQAANIVIPEGIETIEYHAFEECGWIETVILPKSLKSIAHNAFHKCKRLYRVNLPDGLEYIGTQAFSGCERLTSAVLPESLSRVHPGAFLNCPQLVELEISAKIFLDGSIFTVVEEFVPEIMASRFDDTNHEKKLIIYTDMTDFAAFQMQGVHLHDGNNPWYLARQIFKWNEQEGKPDLSAMDSTIARYRVPIKTLFVRGDVSSNTQAVFTAFGNNGIEIFDRSKRETVEVANCAFDNLQLSEKGNRILEIMCLFPNRQIPQNVFYEWLAHFNTEMTDSVKVNEALIDRGLLILTEGCYSISEGVKNATYQSQWLSETRDTASRHKDFIIKLGESANTALANEDIEAIEKTLPYLEDVCKYWRGVPCKEFAWFLSSVASIYESLGDNASTQVLLNRSLTMCEQIEGIDHPEVGIRLAWLARLWARTEGSAHAFHWRAKQLYNKALDIFEMNHMRYHPIALDAYFGLAEKIDFDSAYGMLRWLLSPCIEHLQKGAAPDAANILYHIGLLFLLRKNQESALPWLFQSYAIFMRKDDPIEHPNRIPMVRQLYKIYSEIRGEDFPFEEYNKWLLENLNELPELETFLNDPDSE